MGTSKDKKEVIVRAAFDVAMQHGVQSLTFEEIAKEADLSRQLIRYYFTDNEALMVAVCDYLAGLYREALINGVAEIEDTKRIEFFLDFYFDLLEDHPKPRDDQAYDAMFAFAAGSEAVQTNLRTQYGLLGHVISHEIQLRYANLSAAHCMELSWLFVCLMYGHWKMVATLGYAEDHKIITREAMDRLLASYDTQLPERTEEIKAWAAKD